MRNLVKVQNECSGSREKPWKHNQVRSDWRIVWTYSLFLISSHRQVLFFRLRSTPLEAMSSTRSLFAIDRSPGLNFNNLLIRRW